MVDFKHISLIIIFLIGGSWLTYHFYNWSPLPEFSSYPQTKSISSESYHDVIKEASTQLKGMPGRLVVPSVSVSVGIDGTVVWSETIGFANLEQGIPAGHNTVYRIGNGAKSVTSLAFMILKDQNLIDIDSPANNFLPQVPEDADIFTVRELLTHTAGFGNHNDFGLRSRFNSICECMQFNSVDESMSLIDGYPLYHNPGEQLRYSTYGYIALSKIIEEVSGESFFQFLENSIYKPLEIESMIPDNHPDLDNEIQQATSYEMSDGAYRKWRTKRFFTYRRNLSYNWAGGGMLSTPTDMVKLGNALLTDTTFVKSETHDEFLKPQKFRNEETIRDHSVGLGWTLYPNYEVKFSKKNVIDIYIARSEGIKNGSGNIFLLVPEFRFVMNVAINGTGDQFSFNDFWEEVLNISKPFLRELHNQRTQGNEMVYKADFPYNLRSSF